VREHAACPGLMGGTELVHHVDMRRHPSTSLFTGEEMDVQLRLDFDTVIPNLAPSDGVSRGAGEWD
jgi:hypothetical protein